LNGEGFCDSIPSQRGQFEAGRDVSPWLSDRVRTRKDDEPLADLMFNDWQISHFHLGNVFATPKKVGPRPKGELLLFAHVKADRVTFLDLHPHGAWTMQQILRVLHQTSPQDMPEMKGVLGTQMGPLTDAELLQLRRAGVTAPIHLDGKVFLPPGLGISTSGHAARLAMRFNNLSKQIRNIHRRLKDNDLPHSLLRQLIIIGIPVRLGIKLRSDGCLVLHEKTRRITEGQGTSDPQTFSFGGCNLVPDPLGGDLPFKLGKGQQHIECQPAHRSGGAAAAARWAATAHCFLLGFQKGPAWRFCFPRSPP
jgi:hypothetical protein